MNELENFVALAGIFYVLGANARHYNMAKKWCESHSRCDTSLFDENMKCHADLLSYVNSIIGTPGRKIAYKLYSKCRGI